MYLLLAAIVLLLLFAASFGGRGTWLALTSTTLSVALVAGITFIATAQEAGPYFKTLAAESPALMSPVAEDLAHAAERTAAARAASSRTVALQTPPPAPIASTLIKSDGTQSDWPDLSWFTPANWLGSAVDWLNPLSWFESGGADTAQLGDTAQDTGRNDTGVAPTPQAEALQAPMPTVRALMQPREENGQGRDPAAPSYRIVTAPPPVSAPVTAPLPKSPGPPVKWLESASVPAGMSRVLLTGTNVSNTPLEDIQATLKPDSEETPLGIENIPLSLRIERQDGTATQAAAIPPGARFHLQAAGLTDEDAKQLGGAIVSFAYSQEGRRRTSIMYLEKTALTNGDATTQ